MAKSIYALLDDLMTETSVPAVTDKDGKNVREYHGMVRHTFPRSALPTSAQFEDAEELLTWAEDAGVLHACLQSGVQSRIIDYRAIFKGMKKDDVWSPEFGQENVNTAEWKVVSRPEAKVNVSEAKAEATKQANVKMAQAMSDAGLDNAMIITTLSASCGADMAKEIVNSLT